jgi:hypothetical protein
VFSPAHRSERQPQKPVASGEMRFEI